MTLIKKGSGALARAVANSQRTVDARVVSRRERLMLLIDVSPSMASRWYDEALGASEALIHASGPTSAIGILPFGGRFDRFPPTPPTHARHPLHLRLAELRADPLPARSDGTAYTPAITVGCDMVTSEPAEVRRLVLLSDGAPEDLDEALSAASGAARQSVVIDTVLCGRDSAAAEQTLREIAQRTGGVYMRAADTAALRRSFLALEARVRGLLK